MTSNPIARTAYATARRLARGFPVVVVTGPRQSGKTTLAKTVFAGKPYVTLEDPEVRQYAQADPRGFFARYTQGAVLDEVQRCPELLSYLQGVVDESGRMGEFVLTGSQQFGLLSALTQSLAGRAGRVELLPFTMTELAAAGLLPASVDTLMCRGLYPPLYSREVAPGDWFSNYVATYLERDVRQLLAVRDLATFQRFIKLCAARSGQLLNLSSLAVDAGISHVTAREWVSVLEASYIIHLLRPWHRNFGKRLVKTPKLYFVDVGLMAWLLGIRDAATLSTHAQRGALFETLVVGEFIKRACHAGMPPEMYFWRDNLGLEVDLLLPAGERMQAVEVKSGATVAGDWFHALRKWQALAGAAALAPPWLLFGGGGLYEREGALVTGWRELAGTSAR